MSTWPRYGKPVHWGVVLLTLLALSGVTFLILGSWRLSDGSNGILIDHTNPYIHFSETNASQEVTDGIIYLVVGVACVAASIVLLFTRRKFLLPQEN
jgi:hypothetical protein